MDGSARMPLLAAGVVAAITVAGAEVWAQADDRQGHAACRPCAADDRLRRRCGRPEHLRSRHIVTASCWSARPGDGNCALGRTWGFDAKSVWVADGCRGTFALSDARVTVDCSAAVGAREVCQANTSAGVALVKGSPACMLGRTWGYDKDGIWVADGCQATFVLNNLAHCASAGRTARVSTAPPTPRPASCSRDRPPRRRVCSGLLGI